MQVDKSVFDSNTAAYGAGAFVAADNAPSSAACTAGAASSSVHVVTFNQSQFVSNSCGPQGAGGGASVFWSEQYTADILCFRHFESADAPTSASTPGSNSGAGRLQSSADCAEGTQQLCSQCLHIQGCADWSGNAQAASSAAFAALQAPRAAKSSAVNVHNTPASVPPPSALRSLRRRQQQRYAARDAARDARSSSGAQDARPVWQRSLLQASNGTGGRDAGLASGPVALRALQPTIERYAAGTLLNVSVEVCVLTQRLSSAVASAVLA